MNDVELWAEADGYEELGSTWDPNAAELPAEALQDEEWLRKRLLALRFARRDLEAIEAQVNAEIGRIEKRASELRKGPTDAIAGLEGALEQYHRTVLADDKARKVKKPRTTVTTVWGKLRSGGGRAKVQVTDLDAAVAFLRANNLERYLRHQPEEWHVNLATAPEMVRAVGVEQRVLTEDGEEVPGLRAVPAERWFKQDT